MTEAAAEAKGRPGAKSGKGGKRGSSDTGPNEKPDIYKIVRMCMERNYDTLIVFSFSKKECENLAKQVGSYVKLFLVTCTVILCCLFAFTYVYVCSHLITLHQQSTHVSLVYFFFTACTGTLLLLPGCCHIPHWKASDL